MSLRCVEMAPFFSVKLSSFCLFSYTFRLRSSFINIFFSQCSLPPRLCPSVATMEPPPASEGLSCVFCAGLGIRPFLRVTPSGRRAPHSSKASSRTRYVVNRNPGGFPTGRKTFYKWTTLFPAGRKPGVAGCRYSAPLAPSHRGRRRGKEKLQEAKLQEIRKGLLIVRVDGHPLTTLSSRVDRVKGDGDIACEVAPDHL